MRSRREFFSVLGGAAAMPFAARAQERVRRIGVLSALAADDPEKQARIGGVPAGTGSSWAGPSAATCGSTSAGARAMPSACSQARGRIGRARAGRHPGRWHRAPWGRCCRRPAPCRSCSRIVRRSGRRRLSSTSLARPGGNATGFVQFEYSMSGKWLELLKQIAPGVTRAAVLRDADRPRRDRSVRRHPVRGAVARGGGQPDQLRDPGEIERDVAAFARAGQWRPDRDGERAGGDAIAT